jgi:hypothetical protein
MSNPHVGSTLESFLEEEGILEQATIKAVKARLAQVERALVKLIDAHDAPEPVRAKAIEDALFVGRGLTF